MARNREPVSEEELAALGEEMEAQAAEIRQALAEDLGGEPEDYDAANHLDRTGETAADGGDE